MSNKTTTTSEVTPSTVVADGSTTRRHPFLANVMVLIAVVLISVGALAGWVRLQLLNT